MKTQPAPTHTPTPWILRENTQSILDEKGNVVVTARAKTGSEEALANAAFIVKAVNCHEELLATIKHVKELLDQSGLNENDYGSVMDYLNSAIAKAEAK